MRTSRRGSRLQPALRATRAVVPLTLTVAMGLTVPAPAEADPESADMRTLVMIGSAQTRLIERPGARPWVYSPRSVPT